MGPANYRCLSGRLIFGNADRRTTVTRVVYLCLARLPHIVTMNTRAGTHSTDVVEQGIKYEFMGWRADRGIARHNPPNTITLTTRVVGEYGSWPKNASNATTLPSSAPTYSRQIHEDEIKMMIRGDMRVNIPPSLPRIASATDAGVG